MLGSGRPSRGPGGLRARAGLALVLAVALGAAACGSEDSSSESGSTSSTTASSDPVVAKAQAAVRKARQPLAEWTGPTEPPGPAPKGKKVVAITCQNTAPLCLRSAQSTKEAGELLGWETQIVDGKGNPQTWANAINTALTSDADAIVMNSSQPGLVPEAVKAAQTNGVPVVTTLSCSAKPVPGVVNEIESDRHATGFVLGQYVIANAPDGAEILSLELPAFGCLKRATAGFDAAIREGGGKWKVVERQTSPLTEIASPAGAQRMAAMMRQAPEAKYFWTMSESWANSFQNAVKVTREEDITGLGIDSDFFLPQVRQGANFVQAGPDTNMYGYWAVDALIRAFNKKPQVDEDIPFRLVDKENAKEIAGDKIVADYDYQAEFRKLWGVE